MNQLYINHAIRNVWCSPNQDSQAIIKPVKITPFGGLVNRADILYETVQLPMPLARFHLYQIGQLFPTLLGLIDEDNKWFKVSDVCNTNNILIDIYTVDGTHLPRFQTWYMKTPDNNLVFAVKLSPYVDLNNEDIFFRYYTNEYYSLPADPVNNVTIFTYGQVVRDTTELLTVQQLFDTYKAKSGTTYAFVNGVYTSTLNLFSVTQFDATIEFVYDCSIYKELEFNVSDLSVFTSVLDKQRKYLIHYPGIETYNGIEYHDDVEFFLTKRINTANPSAGVVGTYIHRNAGNTVRMVTHKDYAIPVDLLLAFIGNKSIIGTDITDLYIKVYLRKSGIVRPLIFENNRIKELYKLSDNQVVSAMLGIDSVIEEWTAANLENSDYTKIMRSSVRDINAQLVESAYGYNSLSVIFGNTPSSTITRNQLQAVIVPNGLTGGSTGFEYTSDGIYLGCTPHVFGAVYEARFDNTRIVELLAGNTDTLLDEVYGEQVTKLNPSLDYRMYTCTIVSGVPDNNWTDVTNGPLYVITNGHLQWLTDPSTIYTLVRSNKTILGYDFLQQVTEGVLDFTLSHRQKRGVVTSLWNMQIPLGELDIILNGYSLIENLDYFVEFPRVTIVNKKYLVSPEDQAQKITVRFSGFPNNRQERVLSNDNGFVVNGTLSKNNKFDIRDDKVLRIIVGGKLQLRNNLTFVEDTVVVPAIERDNGAPYLIRDIVVPLRSSTTQGTYELRNKSIIIDRKISDYLTLKHPQKPTGLVNVIPERYSVYSPFCSRVISDLKVGILDDPIIYNNPTDQDVINLCKPYEYLLKVDPTQEKTLPDLNYVIIHPHYLNTVVELNLFHYQFVVKVIKLYLNDRVQLSEFVKLSN